ncbi:hypothetical protein [Exiguobacterium sp. 17-1]|uniref:hypothetical protein n=1 Tax=Exiguobacterium sp. 17-1 TaxID=2931981 RepID=UPI001FFFFE0B|nr:hypothetical protein [Exiguobacterium sp. 17-1]MCK2156177.1 hypothetical protein [Exiguobacterium sp. 17-1]
MITYEKLSTKTTVDTKKITNFIWYVSILLFSSNFFGLSEFLLYLFIFVGLFHAYINKSRFRISKELLVVFLFTISYTIISSHYANNLQASFILYFVYPFSAYFIGSLVVNFNNFKLYTNTIICLSLGLFFHGILNVYFYVKNGNHFLEVRVIRDYWEGFDLAATLQGSYFTLIISLLLLSVTKIIDNKIIKTIIIISIFFSIISSFYIGNRTLIMICIIVFFTNIILFSKEIKLGYKSVIKFLILLCSIIFFVYFIIEFDIFSIKTIVESTNLYSRINEISIIDDPRINIYTEFARQFYKYPFGGKEMILSLAYAHNMWLDIYHVAGFVPFILLIILNIMIVKNVIFIYKSSKINTQIKILAITTLMSLSLNFMVEPIMEGIPFLFSIFMLINGMNKKIKDVIKEKENESIMDR